MQFIKQIGATEFALGLAIVFVPFIPSNILSLLDFIIIRFLAVLAVLWGISRGPMIGIFTFVLIAALYLERNRQKIINARYKFAEIVDVNTPVQMTIEEEGESQKVVPVQDFDSPENRIFYYAPKDGCAANSNDFTPPPPSESLNAKVVFNTIPQGSKSAGIFEKEGYGHLPGMGSPA